MAAGDFVREVGTVEALNSDGTSVITVASTPVPVGNLLSLGAMRSSSTGITVADSAGNTWTVVDNEVNSQGFCQSVAYCDVTVQIPVGGTITITWDAAAFTNKLAKLLEWESCAGLDVSAVARDEAFPRSQPSVGVATTDADVVVVSFITCDDTPTSFTATTNFTERGTEKAVGIFRMFAESRLVSATGTYTSAPTVDKNGYWVAHILAFETAAAGAPSDAAEKLHVLSSNLRW